MSMTSSSLSAEAVAAIEDAYLRREWTHALNTSRQILAARIASRRNFRDFMVLTAEEERVLSLYLQATFELNLDNEVETVVAITSVLTPLPHGVAVRYCHFLIAMNRRLLAKQTLQDVLKSLAGNGGVGMSTAQYFKAAETMTLQLLLPDEGIKAAQQFVAEDKVLDDEAKLQLLHRLQTMHLAAQEANEDCFQTLSMSQPVKNASDNAQVPDATDQSVSTAFTGTQQSDTKQDDGFGGYVVIGTTAIALAAVAAGVLRYREKIYECVSNAIPAISQGVADAKFAIFEA